MPVRHKQMHGPQAPANLRHRGGAGHGLESSAAPARCATGPLAAAQRPRAGTWPCPFRSHRSPPLPDRRGEQLLGSCRSLLGSVSALSEQAQLLRRGDSGVLKVAASPVQIETVFSTFLHQYARRYPNVQVKLIEAIGTCTVALLEAGEIHLGVSLLQSVPTDDHHLGIYPVPPVELLAACHPSFPLERGSTIDISRVASHPLLLLDPGFVVRKTFDTACRFHGITQGSVRKQRLAQFAGVCRGGTRDCRHSVGRANASLYAAPRSYHPRGQATSGAIGHRVGQAARASALCPGLLRNASRPYARASLHHRAVDAKVGPQKGTSWRGERWPRSETLSEEIVVKPLASDTLYPQLLHEIGDLHGWIERAPHGIQSRALRFDGSITLMRRHSPSSRRPGCDVKGACRGLTHAWMRSAFERCHRKRGAWRFRRRRVAAS
jgi:DNA-binding transcriptional LysR family regulator